MFYFCKKPQYRDAFEATANFLRMNNVVYRERSADFQMLANRNNKTFEVGEEVIPAGALETSAEFIPKIIIEIYGVCSHPKLERIATFGIYKTIFNYRIKKPGEFSYFSGPQWSDNVENFDSEFSIYNEYNKQLKQLFTDIKHALNPEFWVNPDKILKLEEEYNETSTSCYDS